MLGIGLDEAASCTVSHRYLHQGQISAPLKKPHLTRNKYIKSTLCILLVVASFLSPMMVLGNPSTNVSTQLKCGPFTTETLPEPMPQRDTQAAERFQTIKRTVEPGRGSILFLGDFADGEMGSLSMGQIFRDPRRGKCWDQRRPNRTPFMATPARQPQWIGSRGDRTPHRDERYRSQPPGGDRSRRDPDDPCGATRAPAGRPDIVARDLTTKRVL